MIDFTKYSTKELKKMLKNRDRVLLQMGFINDTGGLIEEMEIINSVLKTRKETYGKN